MADACPAIVVPAEPDVGEESPGNTPACVTPFARATGMCSLAGWTALAATS